MQIRVSIRVSKEPWDSNQIRIEAYVYYPIYRPEVGACFMRLRVQIALGTVSWSGLAEITPWGIAVKSAVRLVDQKESR